MSKEEGALRLVQLHSRQTGRRVGLIRGDQVFDITSVDPSLSTTLNLFERAQSQQVSFLDFSRQLQLRGAKRHSYPGLLERRPGHGESWLLPPVDHPDPAHCLVSGTGLTHLGSVRQRDAMHLLERAGNLTDSQKIFLMGLEKGKPESGRGVQPEWFFKGSGLILRGPNDTLEIPSFAEDGGEEAEIAGCYVIDETGTPCRLGFAVGNEWSDHQMEQRNYLWLAPSKLRTCSIGPELVVTEAFESLTGRVTVHRGTALIFDSGEISTGQEHMCHSLANLEDHHFKHDQFRHPGDVHIHFFGTAKFSFGQCDPLRDGDRVEICFEGMGAPLVNYVSGAPADAEASPVRVRPARQESKG